MINGPFLRKKKTINIEKKENKIVEIEVDYFEK